MKTVKVKNPEKVRSEIREYYEDAELWLPEDPSRRVYRFRKLNAEGEVHFIRLRDRITSESKLRQHLLALTPIDVYFSVSCWLNPTKTSIKTYRKEADGRKHLDKNGFMYSDVVLDQDHLDRDDVAELYDFLAGYYPEDSMYLVFSGGGWHINLKKWYRNKKVADAIEREERFEDATQRFAEWLDELGFQFDYQVQKKDDGTKWINSPTTDTRRVRKLPGTLTRYGNKAEIVPRKQLFEFSPSQKISPVETFNTEHKLSDYKEEVSTGGNTDSRVLLENTESEA